MVDAKEPAAALLCAIGLPMYARWRHSRRLAILMFHGVEREPLSPPCGWVIDTATLRRDLEYVRRHYRVLPLQEALERLQDGSLPKRAAAVTFDDGTRNLLTNAAPVLHDLAMPAAVFLATGPMGTEELLWPDRVWQLYARTTEIEVDLSGIGLGIRSLRTMADRVRTRDTTIEILKQMPDGARVKEVESLVVALGEGSEAYGGPFQLLSWDEARALSKGGLVTLYPHSVTHPILSRCDDEKLGREVSESCRAIEMNTGRPPIIFAYPNGGIRDIDERTRVILRENGIRWALSTVSGFVAPDADPFAVPRLGFSADQSFAVFKLRISGVALRRQRHRASGSDVLAQPNAGRNVGV